MTCTPRGASTRPAPVRLRDARRHAATAGPLRSVRRSAGESARSTQRGCVQARAVSVLAGVELSGLTSDEDLPSVGRDRGGRVVHRHLDPDDSMLASDALGLPDAPRVPSAPSAENSESARVPRAVPSASPEAPAGPRAGPAPGASPPSKRSLLFETLPRQSDAVASSPESSFGCAAGDRRPRCATPARTLCPHF